MINRRRFLQSASLMIGAAHLSPLLAAEDSDRSPITNRWSEAPTNRLETEDILVFEGYPGQSFSHQTQLTSHEGKLFLTWSLGIRDEEGPGQRMVVATSDDEGRTWSKPRTIASANPGKFADSVVISSGLRAHEGRLIAYYGEWERPKSGVNPDGTRNHESGPGQLFNSRTSARTSTDGGQTWSDSIPLIPNAVNYMPPAPLKSGRLLFPGNLTYSHTDDPSGLSGWKRVGVPGIPADYLDDYFNMDLGAKYIGSAEQFNEASFFQTDDEVIHMMLRNERQGLLGVTESRDQGASWSKPILSGYTDAVCRAQFGRLPDGRYFGMSCPRPRVQGVWGQRTPAVLATSRDGIHFDQHYVVGDEPQHSPRIAGYAKGGRYGYPYLYVMDQWAFVSYSKNKEDICVLRFPLSELS